MLNFLFKKKPVVDPKRGREAVTNITRTCTKSFLKLLEKKTKRGGKREIFESQLQAVELQVFRLIVGDEGKLIRQVIEQTIEDTDGYKRVDSDG